MTKYNIYYMIYNDQDKVTEQLIESNKEFKTLDHAIDYIQSNCNNAEDYDIDNNDSEIIFSIANILGYRFHVRLIEVDQDIITVLKVE